MFVPLPNQLTKAIFNQAKSMAKAKSFIVQETYSQANGKTILKKETALSFFTMETFSKANGAITCLMVDAAFTTKAATTLSENTKMTKERVSELMFLQQDKRSKANGKAIMAVSENCSIRMDKSTKGSC